MCRGLTGVVLQTLRGARQRHILVFTLSDGRTRIVTAGGAVRSVLFLTRFQRLNRIRIRAWH
jgi:hypothetical protein